MWLKKLTGMLVISVSLASVNAQDCDSNYLSILFKNTYYSHFVRSIITPQNEIVTIGNLNYPHSFMNKLTAQGNILWANEIALFFNSGDYYANLNVQDVIAATDSTYFVVGSVQGGLYSPPGLYVLGPSNALLINVDKYGHIVWSRRFFGVTSTLYFTNIFKMRNGNFIAYMAIDNGASGFGNNGKVVCLDPNGSFLWASYLSNQNYNAAGSSERIRRAITQTSNGNIVIGDVVYNRDFSGTGSDYIQKGILHFFALDPDKGAMAWENSYVYPLPRFDSLFVPNMIKVKELPDGKLSFLTELVTANTLRATPTQKVTDIVTDNTGNIIDMLGYEPSSMAYSNILDAHDIGSNGSQVILIEDSNHVAMLAQIDKDGNVSWTKGYGNASAGLPPSCFSIGDNSYNIFMSATMLYGSAAFNSQLLITDPVGNINCANTSAQLAVSHPVPLQIAYDNITKINESDPNSFGEYYIPLVQTKFEVQKSVACQKNIPCCVDVFDSSDAHNIVLCRGESFTLPDKTIVIDSGKYYITLTTAKGCDSTIFYNVDVLKNPNDLMLTKDTCLSGQDSLVLHATDSFRTYNWVNNISSLPEYTVYKPGVYWLNVSNQCGSKTDSVQVYDQCEFPVIMPNAFTPNTDGRNDVFRVPPQNKNRLVRLTVFNRWGQLVFATTNQSEDWDGNFKKKPQPAGTFVYYLVMQGLDGKETSQHGTVVLIR